MKIAIFYDQRQSVESDRGNSPSASKPEELASLWKHSDLPLDWKSFEPMSEKDIALVHDPKFVEGILNCTIPNGHSNKSPKVAASLPWVCGSMVAAALHSYKTGTPSFSLTSGAHHSGHSSASGYCTFNSLVLAAVLAHQAGAERIGICDLDNHWGNGTEDIIKKLDFNYITHYSFGANPPSTSEVREWLDNLTLHILNTFDGCDLVIVNAGVDCAITDPLGGVFTDEQLAERDHRVFDALNTIEASVAVALAGGYELDASGSISPVLNRHSNTLKQLHDVFCSSGES